MKPNAYDLTRVCDQYLGVSYSVMDCQGFVEKCLADIGIDRDLSGSNAWYRIMTWVGSPEECKAKFGEIPKGAFLFIWANDGGEKQRGYFDGKGNASHIGIYTGRGKGAIASSKSRGCVAESEFYGKSINGGWNRVGLWNKLSYGSIIDNILEGGEQPVKKALVYAANGKPVNLRAGQSTSAAVLIQVKVGEEVDVLEEGATWDKVKYQELTGYMMNEFLTIVADGGDDVPPEDGGEGGSGFVTIKLPEDVALALLEVLEGTLGKG